MTSNSEKNLEFLPHFILEIKLFLLLFKKIQVFSKVSNAGK